MLRLIKISLALFSQLHLAAFAATEVPLKIRLNDFSGRVMANWLAHSCSDKNWQEFATWSNRTGLTQIEKAADIYMTLATDGRTIKVTNESIEIKVLGPASLEARINGEHIYASDGCELITTLTHKTKTSAWSTLLESFAHAGPLVEESTFNESFLMALGAACMLGAVVGGALALPTGQTPWFYIALMGINALVMHKNGADRRAKLAFADAINEGAPKVTSCTDSTMVLQNGPVTVLVTSHPASVQLSKDGEIVFSDKQSMVTKEARKGFLNLASNCRNAKDAAELTSLMNDQSNRARARMIVLGSDRLRNNPTPPPGPVRLID